MDILDVVIRVAGLVSTLATAGFGVAVFRQKVRQEAEKRLGQIQVETITAQAETISSLNIKTRLIEDIANNEKHSRQQCERALRLAQEAIHAYDTFIGRIWIEGNARAQGLPPPESSSTASAIVDSGQLPNGNGE